MVGGAILMLELDGCGVSHSDLVNYVTPIL